jgi:hypothetical protein
LIYNANQTTDLSDNLRHSKNFPRVRDIGEVCDVIDSAEADTQSGGWCAWRVGLKRGGGLGGTHGGWVCLRRVRVKVVANAQTSNEGDRRAMALEKGRYVV